MTKDQALIDLNRNMAIARMKNNSDIVQVYINTIKLVEQIDSLEPTHKDYAENELEEISRTF